MKDYSARRPADYDGSIGYIDEVHRWGGRGAFLPFSLVVSSCCSPDPTHPRFKCTESIPRAARFPLSNVNPATVRTSYGMWRLMIASTLPPLPPYIHSFNAQEDSNPTSISSKQAVLPFYSHLRHQNIHNGVVPEVLAFDSCRQPFLTRKYPIRNHN
jgi:hypothetical protein